VVTFRTFYRVSCTATTCHTLPVTAVTQLLFALQLRWYYCSCRFCPPAFWAILFCYRLLPFGPAITAGWRSSAGLFAAFPVNGLLTTVSTVTAALPAMPLHVPQRSWLVGLPFRFLTLPPLYPFVYTCLTDVAYRIPWLQFVWLRLLPVYAAHYGLPATPDTFSYPCRVTCLPYLFYRLTRGTIYPPYGCLTPTFVCSIPPVVRC